MAKGDERRIGKAFFVSLIASATRLAKACAVGANLYIRNIMERGKRDLRRYNVVK